jgi:hypothetical protein
LDDWESRGSTTINQRGGNNDNGKEESGGDAAATASAKKLGRQKYSNSNRISSSHFLILCSKF